MPCALPRHTCSSNTPHALSGSHCYTALETDFTLGWRECGLMGRGGAGLLQFLCDCLPAGQWRVSAGSSGISSQSVCITMPPAHAPSPPFLGMPPPPLPPSLGHPATCHETQLRCPCLTSVTVPTITLTRQLPPPLCDHVQVALSVPGASPVHKATIVPRGHALGMVTQVSRPRPHTLSHLITLCVPVTHPVMACMLRARAPRLSTPVKPYHNPPRPLLPY